MKDCKHKYVSMEDGTLDIFCVRCSKKSKQAVMVSETINLNVNVNINQPDIKQISTELKNQIKKSMRM